LLGTPLEAKTSSLTSETYLSPNPSFTTVLYSKSISPVTGLPERFQELLPFEDDITFEPPLKAFPPPLLDDDVIISLSIIVSSIGY